MVRIAKIKYFNIYSDHKGNYIIHNTHKEFNKGHTHINNYHTAKYITNMALHKSLPNKHLSNYLIISIIRISSDNAYINNLKKLIKKEN